MLELKNICYQAEDGKEILKDISLTINDRFVAVTGPNGGGKSTLAKIIAGIYKASSGQIIYNGQDITEASITERANMGISYAFQQPVRFKGIRVKDLLKIASKGEAGFEDCRRLLTEVGLNANEYLNRELNDSLSGGEMKRIEIATVLARKTVFNVFDEPEAGIDLWSFQHLIKIFEKMYNDTKGSILIISHQERILNIADKIIYIKDGQIEKYGTKSDVLPALLNGTDYTDKEAE